jgi:hypothetical protein
MARKWLHIASEEGKRIQAAIAMGIVHNLLRLFEAKLKSEEGIQDCKVIKAWQKDLAKRAEKARAASRSLPVIPTIALARINSPPPGHPGR